MISNKKLNKRQEFGNVVRKARKEYGMSLRELSLEIGVSAAYISLIENNKTSAPSETFIRILAHHLGFNMYYLLALGDRYPSEFVDVFTKRPQEFAKIMSIMRELDDRGWQDVCDYLQRTHAHHVA